jgi:hypothetical protein
MASLAHISKVLVTAKPPKYLRHQPNRNKRDHCDESSYFTPDATPATSAGELAIKWVPVVYRHPLDAKLGSLAQPRSWLLRRRPERSNPQML